MKIAAGVQRAFKRLICNGDPFLEYRCPIERKGFSIVESRLRLTIRCKWLEVEVTNDFQNGGLAMGQKLFDICPHAHALAERKWL